MVQHGARWCNYIYLRSDFVADMLLKKSEQQMSNKSDANCQKSRKSRKMKIDLKTKKPLTSKGFSYLLLWMVIVVYRRLFTDTKLTKDCTQNIRININLTSDMPQLAHGLADVHGDEVGGILAVEARLGPFECSGRELKS